MEAIERDGDIPSEPPARRPRVRRNVTAALAQDICSERYPVGSPLPRENDLCELYGVSRTVTVTGPRMPVVSSDTSRPVVAESLPPVDAQA